MKKKSSVQEILCSTFPSCVTNWFDTGNPFFFNNIHHVPIESTLGNAAFLKGDKDEPEIFSTFKGTFPWNGAERKMPSTKQK